MRSALVTSIIMFAMALLSLSRATAQGPGLPPECDRACGEAEEAQAREVRAALISAGTPDSLAAAAFFGSRAADPDAEQLALMQRAAALAPQRYDLAWLNFHLCSESKSCNAAALASRLQGLDPGNALSWLWPLDRDEAVDGNAQAMAALKKMAASEHFDVEWVSIVLHLSEAIQRTGKLDASSSLISAVGIASALAIPAYANLANACKEGALEDGERMANCRRLASLMLRGDMYVTEMIGAAIARRVWPEGSAEYSEAAKATRIARYQMGQAIAAATKISWDEGYANKYLAWLKVSKTEQEVSRAQIVDAGLDTEPPQNWQAPGMQAK